MTCVGRSMDDELECFNTLIVISSPRSAAAGLMGRPRLDRSSFKVWGLDITPSSSGLNTIIVILFDVVVYNFY